MKRTRVCGSSCTDVGRQCINDHWRNSARDFAPLFDVIGCDLARPFLIDHCRIGIVSLQQQCAQEKIMRL
jgi:hypothetical protein